jgi:hypothetical protein
MRCSSGPTRGEQPTLVVTLTWRSAFSGTVLTPLDLGQLVSKLEAVASGTRVDVVLLEEAPPALAFRIFRDGQVLFERDHARLVERKARAILEYLDWKPFEEIFIRGVLQAASRRGR